MNNAQVETKQRFLTVDLIVKLGAISLLIWFLATMPDLRFLHR